MIVGYGLYFAENGDYWTMEIQKNIENIDIKTIVPYAAWRTQTGKMLLSAAQKTQILYRHLPAEQIAP